MRLRIILRFGFANSIAFRLTVWYAGSAFLLILAATGFLYWALASNLNQEDQHTLTNTVADLRLLLGDSSYLRLPTTEASGLSHTFQLPQAILVRLLDTRGHTIVETPGMSRELPVSDFPLASTLAPRHDIVRQVFSRSGKLFQTLSARVATTTGSHDQRVIQAAMDRSSEETLLAHYRERLWLVLAVSLVLCVGGGYAIARSGMRPIRRIVETARRIRVSTLHQRIDAQGLPTELRSLAETFNDMLDRLEESFAQISQFSADVAHELRTPVNNLVGEIEVALGKARAIEEYRDVLGSALEECTRIGRVIQSLLFLARSEATTGNLHHEKIEARREIEVVREFYEVTAAEADVQLIFAPGPEIRVGFDRILFQQALGNLIANAIAHTSEGGRIEIRAENHRRKLRIEVRDTGCGIPAEHLPHVFDRFYRVDRARSGASNNVGLGLAMVKSIALIHGGAVSIESQVGHGTCVTLEIPSAPH